jgi:hypothetical protein
MKGHSLRRELEETVRQLEHEAQSFDRLIPKIHEDIAKLDQEIQALGPGLVDRRAIYTDLVEKRASVRASLSLFDQVADLETRREGLAKASEGEGTQTQVTTDLSSTTIDQFAQQVEQLLPTGHQCLHHLEHGIRLSLGLMSSRRSRRTNPLRPACHDDLIPTYAPVFCHFPSEMSPIVGWCFRWPLPEEISALLISP